MVSRDEAALSEPPACNEGLHELLKVNPERVFENQERRTALVLQADAQGFKVEGGHRALLSNASSLSAAVDPDGRKSILKPLLRTLQQPIKQRSAV